MHIYEGHLNSVYTISLNSDGKKLLSTSGDKTVKEWDLESKSAVTYLGHKANVFSAIYSEDFKNIYSSSEDSTIRKWSVNNSLSRECSWEKGRRFDSDHRIHRKLRPRMICGV
ncbi:WD40 repeat domain-containing protein [Desulfosporosinus sp. BICA1-9]|uniref:WD40 repeat domain-containing protein n=1 Tax=Desulfosporosinus sp. BICA1-9 TaxID=1531958 RepID=UPI000E9F04E1|nr:hypothetical protein [Desulfosporosinus sp. BICA1-9]HBW37497.1 hypothetical protein [Desulfosporosinus sp.]